MQRMVHLFRIRELTTNIQSIVPRMALPGTVRHVLRIAEDGRITRGVAADEGVWREVDIALALEPGGCIRERVAVEGGGGAAGLGSDWFARHPGEETLHLFMKNKFVLCFRCDGGIGV